MEIKITITEEEKNQVLKTLSELDAIPHLKYMSMAQIAIHADIKESRVRAILQELINEKRITQYLATDNPKLQRFYYVINNAPEQAVQP